MKLFHREVLICISIHALLALKDISFKCVLLNSFCLSCSGVKFVCGQYQPTGTGYLGQLFIQFKRASIDLETHDVVLELFRAQRQEMIFVDRWKYYYHDSPNEYRTNGDRFAYAVTNRNLSFHHTNVSNFLSSKYCDPIAEKQEDSCWKVFNEDADAGRVPSTKFSLNQDSDSAQYSARSASLTESSSRNASPPISDGVTAALVIIFLLLAAVITAVSVILIKLRTGLWCVISCQQEDCRLNEASTATGAIGQVENLSHVQNTSQLQASRPLPPLVHSGTEISHEFSKSADESKERSSFISLSSSVSNYLTAMPSAPEAQTIYNCSEISSPNTTQSYAYAMPRSDELDTRGPPETSESSNNGQDYSDYYSIR